MILEQRDFPSLAIKLLAADTRSSTSNTSHTFATHHMRDTNGMPHQLVCNGLTLCEREHRILVDLAVWDRVWVWVLLPCYTHSAKSGIAIVSCPSVMLVICGHIGWVTLKLIIRSPKNSNLVQGEHPKIQVE